jgi:hypothetical protein
MPDRGKKFAHAITRGISDRSFRKLAGMRTSETVEICPGSRERDGHDDTAACPTGPSGFSLTHERAYLLTLVKVLRLHADLDSVTEWLTAVGPLPPEFVGAGRLYIAFGSRMLDYARQHAEALADNPVDADGGS